MEKIWLTQYQQGVPATIDPDVYSSLVDFFIKNCQQFHDKPAYSNFGCQITYSQLLTRSREFAAYLQKKLLMKKGDRFAIMLPNVLQYPVTLFGALMAGLTVVNVNPLYTVDELVHQLRDSGAAAIIVLENFAYVLQQALPQTQVQHVLVSKMGELLSFPKSFLINFYLRYLKKKIPAWKIKCAIPFKKALLAGKNFTLDEVKLAGSDIAFLQYTGGTTGVAKGAMLTHRNILANIIQDHAWVSQTLFPGKEIIITPLPLYHIFSLTANCFLFMKLGALNVLITNPRDISSFVKELAKHRFTVMTGVNTLYNELLNHPDFSKLDFSHLRVSLGGGAPVQKQVAERWAQVTGHVLLEGYGLTETSPGVTINPMSLKAYKGSIGLPIPSTDILILDDNDQEVPIGEAGELCVKGPQVTSGYWNMPEETKRVFTEDRWLRTGDIAKIDVDGFVYIVDRKKDMILVSGFNVYPNEVEDVIMQHPGVREVAVIGIKDPNTGEAVKAFIVKKDPALTEKSIISFCHQHLTNYKVPKFIEFREVLPKSPIGKILRKELRVSS